MGSERVCLALILGASRFPALDVEDSPSFATSAQGIASYFKTQADGEVAYRVESRLFDSDLSVIDQRREITNILRDNDDATDLIVYYVGHGGFLRQNQEYYLALRSTERGHEDVTGLRSSSLAEAFRRGFDRVYLVLDSCFAGEVVKEFQPVNLPTVVARRTLKSLPDRGVALLLASSKDSAAISPAGLARTMFCDCLLDVLTEGISDAGRLLSLADVGDRLRKVVVRRFGDAAVIPEVHSPQQTEGDAARIPLFVNPAYREPVSEASVVEQLERRVRELEGRLAATAEPLLELSVRPSRTRVPPDTVVTWHCTVLNPGTVPVCDVELSEAGGATLFAPFDLEPGATRELQFDRHYTDRGGRSTITATAHADGGQTVSTQASARVKVHRPPEPTVLALPRFHDELKRVRQNPDTLADLDVNRLLALLSEGERHYRIATGRLDPPVGWGKRVVDWNREAKSLASRHAVVMVSFQVPPPATIVETIELLAEQIADSTGIRIPTHEFL